jgi:hypothetical protein
VTTFPEAAAIFSPPLSFWISLICSWSLSFSSCKEIQTLALQTFSSVKYKENDPKQLDGVKELSAVPNPPETSGWSRSCQLVLPDPKQVDGIEDLSAVLKRTLHSSTESKDSQLILTEPLQLHGWKDCQLFLINLKLLNGDEGYRLFLTTRSSRVKSKDC